MSNLHYSVLLPEFINSTLIKYLRIMRNLLFLLFLWPLCTKGQDIPVSLRTFKGNYPKFPIDTVVSFPFINVFERTLEEYYISGLPTNLIDKEKGIISTGFTPFYRRYTFEQKRKLLSSVAYVVVERDPVYPPSIVMGVFETKLTPVSNSETRVVISLKEPDARYVDNYNGFEKQLKVQSTGVFEKNIIQRITKN
ncbi:hypothetical protein [Siphonobacter sp. SORGH_AS_1065]|uniref:hypothetical protein n=1 Tax=Siphonobacter sp. SORGH_AS_1065 TaxID=3041795 RepID=UPI002789311F|nr:hypothetical protein [Siphonobacter sp. SORGH_AS_1065]MDQ1089136.1 hypothetical protein [Siphonobacter sp. SORGH_AS_1065]